MTVSSENALDKAEAHYKGVVRNLSFAEIGRIETGAVSDAEQKASPKLRAACDAWKKVCEERTLQNAR